MNITVTHTFDGRTTALLTAIANALTTLVNHQGVSMPMDPTEQAAFDDLTAKLTTIETNLTNAASANKVGFDGIAAALAAIKTNANDPAAVVAAVTAAEGHLANIQASIDALNATTAADSTPA